MSESGVVQGDLFGRPAGIPAGTTAIYPNRQSDKLKVERLLALPEHPDGTPVEFRTSRGTLFANAYVRVVYGDHGPYLEFRREQVVCELKQKFGNRPPMPQAYYEWLVPKDGSSVKVYDQKRDVKGVRNAPAGGFKGDRAEGYADYRPGMIYVSPWDLVVRKGSGLSVPALPRPSNMQDQSRRNHR